MNENTNNYCKIEVPNQIFVIKEIENEKIDLKDNTPKLDLDYQQSRHKLIAFNKAHCVQLDEKNTIIYWKPTSVQKQKLKNINEKIEKHCWMFTEKQKTK